jgi:hypothetical protein
MALGFIKQGMHLHGVIHDWVLGKLYLTLNKQVRKVCTEFIWLKIRASGELF